MQRTIRHQRTWKDADPVVLVQLADSEGPLNFDLQVVQRLPKTRSGKIMRRVLRKVATEDTGDLGDLSTLDDPSVVQEIIQAHQRYRKQHRKGEES